MRADLLEVPIPFASLLGRQAWDPTHFIPFTHPHFVCVDTLHSLPQVFETPSGGPQILDETQTDDTILPFGSSYVISYTRRYEIQTFDLGNIVAAHEVASMRESAPGSVSSAT